MKKFQIINIEEGLKKALLYGGILFLFLISYHLYKIYHVKKETKYYSIKSLKEKNKSKNFVFLISEYYYKNKAYSSPKTIYKIFRNIEKYRPKILEDLPFDNLDIMAIAMVETDFDNNEVGLFNELSPFQILDWRPYLKFVDGNNIKDIKVSIQVALYILRDKFRHYEDKEIALIAYNGVVYDDGTMRKEYLYNIESAKKILKRLYKKAEENKL